MKAQLATKEYVNNQVDNIKMHYAYLVNEGKRFVHIVIPYDKMMYDKGAMYIYATLNSIPYVGLICYNKQTAVLHNLHNGEERTITLNEAKPEENRLLRMIIRIPEHSVLKFDCTDYFEYALTGA